MALRLTASDVSRQKVMQVAGVSSDTLVGEFVTQLVTRMRLPRNDSAGRPVRYHALLEREGVHLSPGQQIGDVAQPDDAVVLQPRIEAG